MKRLRRVFFQSTLVGIVLALGSLWLNHSAHDSSANRIIFWRLLYPFLFVSEKLTGIFFTHNRIAPGLEELVFFETTFVLSFGFATGIVLAAVFFIASKIKRSMSVHAL